MSAPIDVYWSEIDADDATLDRLQTLLSSEERAQAARFRHAPDRRRYIVRHGQLRVLLARYLDGAPGDIRFTRNRFGKPMPSQGDVRFSLSNSYGVALYAIARGFEVGCDIERRDPDFAYAPVADRLFSPSERSILGALAPEQRMITFFRCWTRKEAYAKGRGCGLSLALDQFDALPEGLDESLPDPCDGWSVRSFQPVPGYEAAVAAAGAAWSMNLQRCALPEVELRS
ncbi:MAG: phosphopantetheinyl transferase [Rhodospirillales bacterium]|jgi:4'-phosphopantetheinyl transferase|nr:phosphopantetheinyl transferase [Rhodospirillales bacterium]